MHHLPVGPPLSARLSAAVRRPLLRMGALLPSGSANRRRSTRRPVRRVAVGLGFTMLLTGLVLTVPVVSGAGNGPTPVALDSSSTTSTSAETGDSPVEMGVDGTGTATSSSGAPASASPSAPSPSAAGSAPSPKTDDTGSSVAGEAPAGAPGATGGSTSTAPDSILAAPGSNAGAPLPSAPGRTTPPPSSSAPPVAPSPPDAGDLEGRVLALVVAARDDAGCDESDADRTLIDLARAHSGDMRDRGYTGLVDPDGTSLLSRGADAAAVAQGSADPSAVVSTWLAAPDGRAALLNCSAHDLGVGVAAGVGGPWVTVALA